ncbi:uncharacterized protein LOC123229636 [Mangifera indica]|uniref:uncharacterized protein LOC123229636 n=1 Tax=Mangifera indica TaxID=29780 RepID=UPI001CFB8F2E|nr:uncharacterized protein LOC123229636 [Mangifera indica]
MENYSYSPYLDCGNSSPHSREIDCENQSWDELPSNSKVKFMCSYGGKIQPRPHDKQLAYIGGDTKILTVERNIKFKVIMNKLSALYGNDNFCFKYQLPGEDLDALISVTNDEDLEHMMLEYDRLVRASHKPARLRLFLFTLNSKITSDFGASETKSERQWFVDALNSVQIQHLDGSSPPAAAVLATNPHFLFGLDKLKMPETVAMKIISDVVEKEVTAGADCGSEDRHVMEDQMMEIQRQELHRLNIGGINTHEQANQNPRVGYAGQKLVPEKIAPPPGAIPSPMQISVPSEYIPERHTTAANYPIEQAVYYIPAASAAGVYSAPTLRPVTGVTGQAYYGVQRVVQEQPVYNAVAAAAGSIQQQVKGGLVAEPGYVQVGYDGAGRQVYYTSAAAPAAGVMAQYQAVAVDGKQGGGALNQEGKTVVTNNGSSN